MLHRIPAPRPWTSRFAWLHPKVYLVIHIALGLLLAATCAWLFYQIGDALAGDGRLVAFDQAASVWIEGHNTEAGEKVALGISLLGNQILWPLLALIGIGYIIRREWPRAALIIVASGGGALAERAAQGPLSARTADFRVRVQAPTGRASRAAMRWRRSSAGA